MTSPVCVILLLSVLSSCPVLGYRQLHFTNADVCGSNGKTLTINTGDGALILSLTNKSYTTFGEKKICNILIKAKLGYGLLVHAEDFRLRTNSAVPGDCHDYIEFGREDDIPLWTLERSGKLCGTRSDVKYEEPGGQLLIWLELGGARPPGPPALSIVVTPYTKTRQQRQNGFCECMGPWDTGPSPTVTTEQWIRCKYFCDGRVNCALDRTPADEADVSCQRQKSVPPPRTGGGLISGGSLVSGGEEELSVSKDTQLEPKFTELSLFTMIVLGLLGLSLIACGILCTLKRCGPPAPRGPATVENPNCPEQALSMIELVRMPAVTEENIYCPTPYQAIPFPTEVDFPTSPSHTAASPTMEAPPPSYTDIFPPDYVPPDLRAAEISPSESNTE